MKKSALYEGQPLFQLKSVNWEELKNKAKSENKQNNKVPDLFSGQTPESEKLKIIPRGFTVKSLSTTPTTKSGFSFSDQNIEKEYQSSKGLAKQSFIAKTKEGIGEFTSMFTRTFRRLKPTKENAEIIKELVKYPKLRALAGDEAVRVLEDITRPLNQRQFDIFSRKVFLEDLAEEVEMNHELPGDWTPGAVKTELARVNAEIDTFTQQALDKRAAYNKKIVDDYIVAMKEVGFNVENRFKRKNYFRHQVLDYMGVKNAITGTGKRLRVPTQRGFLKERQGSKLSINTDYLQAEYEVMAQMLHDTEEARMIKRIGDNCNIRPRLEAEAKKTGDKWDDIIPDGYIKWQPREGRAFYHADTIPERMAEELLSGAMEEIGVKADDIKKVFAIGQKFKEFVIREEIAETLDDMYKTQNRTPPAKLTKWLLSKWKGWVLTGNPHTVLKYNLRNITGDLDGVLGAIGFKGISPKYTARAAKELWEAMKYMKFSPEMKEWRDRGGFQTLLYAQEIADVSNMQVFRKFNKSDTGLNKAILRLPKSYLEFTRNMTDYREGILRYAAYLYYKDHLKQNQGLPKFYGASIPDIIKGLKTQEDRAYQLSKDTLGAYDEVTEFGQILRQYFIPFYSWNEINFKRYKRLFANALNNEQLQKNTGQAMAKTLGITTLLGTKTLMTLGRITLRASALTGILLLWNSMFPDEEDDLPEDVRTKPHIIFGRDKEGNVLYFSRLGALNDFFDWFGLDNLTQDIKDLQEGKKSAKEQISDIAWAPINKLVNGLTPYFMVPTQLLAGQTYYSDVRRPGKIRDIGEFTANTIGATEEYKRLTGKPVREDYTKSWQKAAVYKADPEESAYYYALDLKQKFEKQVQNKYPSGVFSDSPKSKALYYLDRKSVV
jgi:hypothetical protein